MEYETTAINVTGKTLVYIFIKPENSNLWRSIAIPLNDQTPLPTRYTLCLCLYSQHESSSVVSSTSSFSSAASTSLSSTAFLTSSRLSIALQVEANIEM